MSAHTSSPPHGSVARHFFNYLSANVLAVVAGFVSFPLLTRLLGTENYGILGYFQSWSIFLIAVLKFGTQHSIVRFYPIYHEPPDAQRAIRFNTNLLALPTLAATLLLGSAICALAFYQHWRPHRELPYFIVVLVLGNLTVVSSFMENYLRASERSGMLTLLNVAARYLQLALVAVIIVFVNRTAMGVYYGQIAASLLVVLVMIAWFVRSCRFDLRTIDRRIIREALSYGIPLVIGELSYGILAMFDRIMIKGILGDFRAVGIYSIGYGLALYVWTFVNATLFQAFVPVANRVYEERGTAAVRQTKRSILEFMTYGITLLALGIYFSGIDAVKLLAGADKGDSGLVFRWIGVTYVLYPFVAVMGFGLTLVKRTRVIMLISMTAAIGNIVLNYLMVPKWGYMGAVYATVLSYGWLVTAELAFCPADLRVFPQPGTVVRALGLGGLFAAACALALPRVGHAPIWRLLTAAGLAIALYVVPALLLQVERRKRARFSRRS